MFIFSGIPLTIKKKSGYWYKTYTNECPVCGNGESERVRQYTRVPDRFSPLRHDFAHVYDWCDYR